ncbi:MAG TPA: transposase [Longimicrobiales bacterium]|nr:transposase [Longimicrobiales bacterium]
MPGVTGRVGCKSDLQLRTVRPADIDDFVADDYHPARPTRDGRTVLALSPLEFLAALSRLIPPPRVHRHRYRYHGVLAPNARLRERVVALGRQDGEALDDTASPAGHDLLPEAGTAESDAVDLPDSPQRAAARSRWARLLARSYEVFPLTCPDCGADMRSLAFITAAEPVDAILTHLGLPTTPPPLSPARGPPQQDLVLDVDPGFDLDQTPAYDPSEPEPVPDFDFDQSTGA